MKYLSKDPFSSKPSTDSYRKGWARVFQPTGVRRAKPGDKAIFSGDWNPPEPTKKRRRKR